MTGSLNALGIRGVYLAMHETQVPQIEFSRLVMAYRDGEETPLPPEGVRMRTSDIIPAGFEPPVGVRFSWMVVPLFLNFEANDQLGYAVFEIDRAQGEICQALGEQLGSPLKGALVLEELAHDMAERRDAEENLARELQAFLAVVDAASEGDLTRRGSASQETLARISTSVNGMLQQFSTILAEVRSAAELVTQSSTEILTAATAIASGAERSSDQVQASTVSVEEMSASMDAVWKNAADSAEGTRLILEHVRHSDASVGAAHEAMARIDAAVQSTAEKMRLLETRTEKISEVIGVIESIAKRLKLLALNASITAAQAGEAGRGFAVVADEVRRLAESSTAAVAEVASRVEGIVSDTQPAIESMEKAMAEVVEGRTVSEQARGSLREVSSLIQASAGISSQIAAASREQAQATKLVAQAMQAVSMHTSRSTTNAREASVSVRRLVTLAEQLDRAVSRFKIDAGASRAVAQDRMTLPNRSLR